MTREERLEQLMAVFPDNKGRQKAEVLYDLARQAQGAIAEVGCSTGFGTVALAYGSMDGQQYPVFAIDPFMEIRGWANEPYGPWLKGEWCRHMIEAEVFPVVQGVMLYVSDVLAIPSLHCHLTFWDLGLSVTEERANWLEAWVQHHVSPGGIVAVNETGSLALKVDEWIEAHESMVEKVDINYYIRILRKR